MKHIYKLLTATVFVAVTATAFYFLTKKEGFENPEGEMDKRTRIDSMMRQQFELTKDLSLGYPPTDRLWTAQEYILNTAFRKNSPITTAKWRERGPYQVGGRTRTLLIDKNDPTGRAAFAAGVAGGVWYTKDIMSNRVVWEPVNDYLENLAVVTLVQDQNNPQIMYFGTGEGYFNADAVRGLGIWKSTDGGKNWNRLTSTANFFYVMKMAIHPNGDVYAATREDGLQRSKDGGQTWTMVLGAAVSTGSSSSVNDVDIASDGSVWTLTGYRGGSFIYKSEAGDNVGNINNWSRVGRASTGFIGGQDRVELACARSNPNVVYALCSTGGAATYIYKTIDGGQSWVKISDAPGFGGSPNFAGDQAWYDLDIAVDPNNASRVVMGGIDLVMSGNGGQSWVPITSAYGGVAPYIHPDQHFIYFYPGSSKTLFIGNDGGIYRSDNADAGTLSAIRFNVINDRYNVTQYYACAIHPGFRSDYFIAGSQDNGTHRFSEFTLHRTEDIWGGDGMVCHIDQTDGEIQVVSSQFGNYAVSLDGGTSFGGGISLGQSSGFVNPSDYDDEANILYARSASNGEYARWEVEGSSGEEIVDITNYGSSGTITALYVSTNVPNRLYLGTGSGRIVQIDNANTGASVTGVIRSLPSGGSVSCIIAEDGNENHILATVSNYGSVSVLESFDNGATWQSAEGNLPDMPVRWVLFDPTDANQALIATEMGVWVTENLDGNNTVWQPSLDGLPTTRVDMLQYRKSDNTIIAATHGRGLFSTDYRSPAAAGLRVDRIGYVGTPFRFENRSYNARKIEWNFGDGNTSTTYEPVHTYNTLGTYTITLTVNDTSVATETIRILPNRDVPYTKAENQLFAGDFETNPDDFGVYTVSGTGFELGNSIIGAKSGTKSGAKAWVTGLTQTRYENNSHSMLYTPNYNLSEEGIYELSFWAKYEFQNGWDGFMVEYSTDLGATWNTLGARDDSWYNYTAATNTAFLDGDSYFTGIQPTYKQFKLDLGDLVGSENVAFRFVFKTNESGVYAGLAIDDFQIRAFVGALETQLISFDAAFLTNNRGDITWSTLPEYQCEGFDLEISGNGRDFTFLEYTDGQGSAIGLTNYQLRLENLIRDLYFFRLKVRNFDGTFFYSDVRVLQRRPIDLGFHNVFPNPVKDKFGFTLNSLVNETMTVNVFDAAGKLVYSETEGFKGIYYEIDASNFSRGVYFLQVIVGDKRLSYKILKQ